MLASTPRIKCKSLPDKAAPRRRHWLVSRMARGLFSGALLTGAVVFGPHPGAHMVLEPGKAVAAPVPSAHPTRQEARTLRAQAGDWLRDAVRLYDERFRVAETGQYLDAIRLNGAEPEALSSIASTGMGLVSLAVGHAIGVLPDADAKAQVTLANLLNQDTSATFHTDRSKNGWFRHWFDARTGAVPDWNRDKFSTIDTAILGGGAQVLSSYFKAWAERTGQPVPRSALLADQLLASVNWPSAIRDPSSGSIHLVFYGQSERPTERVATIPFDEYALLPCMAAAHERATGRPGPASVAWARHFGQPDTLPMVDHGGLTLLGKPTGSVPSHFTHQFAFYLCGSYASDDGFLAEMEELLTADRAWFREMGAPAHLFGLGAGSESVFEAGRPTQRQRYAVARLAKNANVTASPAIMAGFLPIDAARGRIDILRNLHTLWVRGECRYRAGDLEFMWRCPAKAPLVRVNRVEGIDFSTWMLGLSAVHPDLGLDFYRAHAIK